MSLVDTLFSPYILVSGAASVSGIEFPSSDNELQFGLVEQVFDIYQNVVAGDNILFNISDSKTIIISGSSYFMIDISKVYLKEVAPPALP